jgi:hypothetical protein
LRMTPRVLVHLYRRHEHLVMRSQRTSHLRLEKGRTELDSIRNFGVLESSAWQVPEN